MRHSVILTTLVAFGLGFSGEGFAAKKPSGGGSSPSVPAPAPVATPAPAPAAPVATEVDPHNVDPHVPIGNPNPPAPAPVVAPAPAPAAPVAPVATEVDPHNVDPHVPIGNPNPPAPAPVATPAPAPAAPVATEVDPHNVNPHVAIGNPNPPAPAPVATPAPAPVAAKTPGSFEENREKYKVCKDLLEKDKPNTLESHKTAETEFLGFLDKANSSYFSGRPQNSAVLKEGVLGLLREAGKKDGAKNCALAYNNFLSALGYAQRKGWK